ncbi:unnamed protein product [Rodentolepis nana]|uniref:Endo/exonuclease/phosphatase domain-containing protein n=1 Tax=Rodentolepis nana TaxID=102285 RepID=A0A0R3U0C9_RODNA|nr:unnamed protein product [Rodentolepis nana]
MISLKQGYKRNRLRQGESRLQILQWNAGGMSQDKKIQVQKILQTYDVDTFTIMEANISDDKLKCYQFPGFTLYLLLKYRQVASGILTGVKEGLTSHYDLIKIYNPPQNCLNFDFLNISHKTVVLGDFNVHSTRWGYKDTDISGKEIEDMLNSNPLELIYSSEDPATYLHYNGTRTTPHLLLASSDISEHTRRNKIDDPGSDHKPVIASITIGSKSMTRKVPTSYHETSRRLTGLDSQTF